MGRPKLPEGQRRICVQVFLEPPVARAAKFIADKTGQPLSAVVSRMARAGARETVETMLKELAASSALTRPPGEPAPEPEQPPKENLADDAAA